MGGVDAVKWAGDLIAGRIQTENWSAELEATTERIVLKGPRSLRYEVPASQVAEVRVGVGKLLFFSWRLKRTVVVAHSGEGAPEPLAFRARNVLATEILMELERRGYTVGAIE